MYTLDDLLYLMARLRHPDHGCPWDCKQTYRTILPYTIEEAYEVADAIERDDMDELRLELGDLLFQVVFHSQIAREQKCFDFASVVDSLVQKLVRRHPHVFPHGNLRAHFLPGQQPDEETVKGQWEAIKAAERAGKGRRPDQDFHSLLDDIPNNMPVLSRAAKLQKRASQHGFDWPSIGPVFHKVAEELEELRQVLCQDAAGSEAHKQARLEDEMGDLLFACVNLSRFLKVTPESALRCANEKFVRRFQYIEKVLAARGESVDEATLEAMDRLWEEAKAVEA
jgi:ATP diphosphatase